ncbi:peptidylprolyl isomerase [Nakamurella sp. YIM 132084]|uniref:Peptidylprolyl isomerase n=1 Tax=Nakamurella leprariae TaxID=2803911 RepID=A0A938YF56_9ACTN|nr:peptidylprolyl isomerase [Nakamurella leprariae]
MNSGTVDVTLELNDGAVPITLDRTAAPCSVNSFLSLASQGFFDDTTCHRVTDSGQLNILQCGDPTGTGTGGPGYTFADEPGSTEELKMDSEGQVTIPAGSVVVANAGPYSSTSGSQFFITGTDARLGTGYTKFGTVSGDGLAVISSIVDRGTADGSQDGAPAETVTITSVQVPEGSLDGTGDYPEPTSPAPTDAVPTDAVPSENAPSESAPAESTEPAPTS